MSNDLCICCGDKSEESWNGNFYCRECLAEKRDGKIETESVKFFDSRGRKFQTYGQSEKLGKTSG